MFAVAVMTTVEKELLKMTYQSTDILYLVSLVCKGKSLIFILACVPD